jgi:hypothetical protein
MTSAIPEAPVGRRGYLLLRRGGGIWGIANSQVTSLVRQGRHGLAGRDADAAYRVGTAAEPLAADEILGVAAELEVRQPARAVAGWWPAGTDGCAVWSGLPVVLVDPRCPPHALRLDGEAGDPSGRPGGEPNDGD